MYRYSTPHRGRPALAALLALGTLAGTASTAQADGTGRHEVVTEEVRQEVTVTRHSTGTPPPSPAAPVVETRPAPPPAATIVVTDAPPPPPPRPESPAGQPAPDYRWVPGHWVWQDGTWNWQEGAWERPPQQTAEWVPGRWEQRPEGWVWVPGYWS